MIFYEFLFLVYSMSFFITHKPCLWVANWLKFSQITSKMYCLWSSSKVVMIFSIICSPSSFFDSRQILSFSIRFYFIKSNSSIYVTASIMAWSAHVPFLLQEISTKFWPFIFSKKWILYSGWRYWINFL